MILYYLDIANSIVFIAVIVLILILLAATVVEKIAIAKSALKLEKILFDELNKKHINPRLEQIEELDQMRNKYKKSIELHEERLSMLDDVTNECIEELNKLKQRVKIED